MGLRAEAKDDGKAETGDDSACSKAFAASLACSCEKKTKNNNNTNGHIIMQAIATISIADLRLANMVA